MPFKSQLTDGPMKRARLILLALCGFFCTVPLIAASSNNDKALTIYLFWGEGCSHCAKAKPFLKELEEKYPQVHVQAYEIKSHPENKDLAKKMAAEHGFVPTAIPTIFIEEDYFEGFNEGISQKIEDSVKKHLKLD